jgi:hypothetical protein
MRLLQSLTALAFIAATAPALAANGEACALVLPTPDNRPLPVHAAPDPNSPVTVALPINGIVIVLSEFDRPWFRVMTPMLPGREHAYSDGWVDRRYLSRWGIPCPPADPLALYTPRPVTPVYDYDYAVPVPSYGGSRVPDGSSSPARLPPSQALPNKTYFSGQQSPTCGHYRNSSGHQVPRPSRWGRPTSAVTSRPP